MVQMHKSKKKINDKLLIWMHRQYTNFRPWPKRSKIPSLPADLNENLSTLKILSGIEVCRQSKLLTSGWYQPDVRMMSVWCQNDISLMSVWHQICFIYLFIDMTSAWHQADVILTSCEISLNLSDLSKTWCQPDIRLISFWHQTDIRLISAWCQQFASPADLKSS